jgi:uncharacterized protein YggE
MNPKPLGFVLVLLSAAVLLPACAGSGTTVVTGEGNVDHGITVTGVGEANATPDMATIDVGVEVSAGSVALAREGAASAAQRLISAAKANGVADRDIQTRSVSVSPVYDYSRQGPPTIIGYTAGNLLTLRIRDLDRLSVIIDSSIAAAGDAARLQGVQFGFADDAALRKAARENAIADARQRAETYAAAAGVRVGEVLAIAETVSTGPIPLGLPRAPAAGAFDTATPIERGESTVSVAVTVRFAFEK